MTPQYILEKSLARRPHCFSAHVPGEGYINNGLSLASNVANFWRQYHRTARAEIANLGWASKYGECGYEQPKRGVLMANWNNLAEGVDRLLERAGYAIEWSDEWTTCSDCDAALRIQPDSMGWEPSYCVPCDEGGDILCRSCCTEHES